MQESIGPDIADGAARAARHRFRRGSAFAGGLLLIYFTFISFIGFAPQLAGALLQPGLSVALLLGVAVILFMCVLSFAYAATTNADDRAIAELER
ncbi:DUF485 domain-containing protein [Bradyrhizobium sp. NP1]|uniref:DUF485 domain-containing protein n=1 Tax=Bradyrhizobium sp. NP1 TaxID=3049772 RepID=UPI0025A55342|nr:DUF485 domain-containing protein [Bradyrhizobium sp. NP1]WJR78657.1 DUF485 domain-containing protein [Bradyrhizobium sp. NP1]